MGSVDLTNFLRVGAALLAFLVIAKLGHGGMVDTVQFGHIQVGMREKEVIERLGPPDKIQAAERRVTKGGGWRKITRKRLIYVGVNPTSGQRITTTIVIENGKVADKIRSYR